MYVLNDVEISESRLTELVEDLAMFPFNEEDIKLPIEDRKIKYLSELNETKVLELSNTLKIKIV